MSPTADKTLAAATYREAIDPEPTALPDDKLEPLPFTELLDVDDDGCEDPTAYGWLPVRSGRR